MESKRHFKYVFVHIGQLKQYINAITFEDRSVAYPYMCLKIRLS